jgi:hypothetical protein
MERKFTQNYNPLYFLSALGNGGLAVSFFMYLMFMVKHPDAPIPNFSHVFGVLSGGSTLAAILVGAALLGILYFAFRHVKLLVWNVKEYRQFKKTEAFAKLKSSNSEVTLMALPLTYAMFVNVLFIIGAVFVPGLWSYVEYLFPFSLLAFFAIGVYALKIFSDYFSRLMIQGDFDFINNNNLSQLLASFSFAMIGVGMAAPGAMSHHTIISVLGILGAIFFSTISILLLFIKLVLGFKSIFKQGISKETAPTLWIVIPIMTLLGITFVRVTSGIYHNLLHTNPSPVFIFVVLAFFISLQMVIGLIGYVVLNRTGYFKEYVNGEQKSVGSYALICPGVASFVLGMFFVHWGLVKTEILEIFSPGYFAVLLPLIAIQIKTIHVTAKLNKKHICKGANCLQKEKNDRIDQSRPVMDASGK